MSCKQANDFTMREEEIVAAAPDTSCFDEDKHPWPYLREMFLSVGPDEVPLCLPKYTEILAFKNSPSNLKKHIEVSYSCESAALVLSLTISQFIYVTSMVS